MTSSGRGEGDDATVLTRAAASSVTPPDATPDPSGVDPGPASGPLSTAGDTVVEANGPLARLKRNPLVRRVTGYSAGSVVAAFTSELAFAFVFGWLHGGTAWASLAGFVGGAIPNYFLNRRWAWQEDRRGRKRSTEVTLYAIVTIASFSVSVVATSAAERWARHLTAAHDTQVVLVSAAYLAVQGVFFVGKFVLYELVVFKKGSAASRS